MATFEVTTPNGTFEVTAPDEQSALDALRKEGMMEAAPAQMGVAEDVGRSTATGIREGVESGVGMFGDAAKMTGDMLGWAAGKMGFGEGVQEGARTVGRRVNPFGFAMTTDEIRGITDLGVNAAGAEKVLGHKPQTVYGEYGRTFGNFLPAAALGPGSLPQKVAAATIPAFASESAGQIARHTGYGDYENLARAGGALAGGIGASYMTRPKAAKMPSAEDIKASAGYSTLKPELQAAKVNNQTYRGVVSELRAVADDFGIVPEEHNSIMSILGRHTKQAATKEPTLYDMELLRRSLNNAGQSTTNRSARELSRQLVSKLDEIISSLDGGNVISGAGKSIDETVSTLKQARETYRTGLKGEMIEAAMEKAQNAGSGFENGLRIEFRKILNNKTLSRQFSKTELEAIRKVVKGGAASNIMRFLGTMGLPTDQGRNFLGAAIGGSIGATVGSALGPVGTAVGGPLLVAAGTGAKSISNAMTRAQAQMAEAVVKGGPNAAKMYKEAMQALTAARNAGLIRSGVQAKVALEGRGASR